MTAVPKPTRGGAKIQIEGVPFSSPTRFDEEENKRNMETAAKRDGNVCQWCLRVNGKVKAGSTPHHIFRKRRNWSVRGMITLCAKHHDWFHKAHQENGETVITVEKLEKLIEEIYAEEKWTETTTPTNRR